MHNQTCTLVNNNGIDYMVFNKWKDSSDLIHCFTTRNGGISTGIFSSLNLGFNRGDIREHVLKNYENICNAIGVSMDSLVLSKQVHETNIVEVTSLNKGNGIIYPNKWESVDGIYTKERNVTLVTHYADCVPLFFYAPKSKVIGMAHAGWRGTVREIAKVMVDLWKNKEGINLEEIEVAIGPSIGSCCFEVDKEVADEFVHLFNESQFIKYNPLNGKYNIDLWECNKQILIKSGILEKNISISGICTCCNKDLFFSHRASEGKRGTLGAFMALK